MTATKSDSHARPDLRKTAKSPPPSDDDLPGDGPTPIWNEASRRAVALRLMEQLDDGVELAQQLANDPYFRNPDDRVTAVLTLARMTNANANLGRAITQLIQVEQKRRTIIERVEPVQSWNDSKLKQENELLIEIQKKMTRYMKVVADETFDPAIQEADEAAKKAAAEAAEAANAAKAAAPCNQGNPDESAAP